jgi:hypothetical protein
METLPLLLTLRFLTNFILHFGHVPRIFDFTSACIGQTYSTGAGFLRCAVRTFCAAVTTGAWYKFVGIESNATTSGMVKRSERFIFNSAFSRFQLRSPAATV